MVNQEGGTILKGLKVLDLTRLLPGPLCTMMMGDYGAEVIKVEDLYPGDPTRAVGRQIDGSGAFFHQLNRNKMSICLNLKDPEGKEAFLRLTEQCDVLVEGFRPGVMERLGLSYAELSAVNPGIVYASISGYGQEGPYRLRAGHDLNYTALTGLLDLSSAPGEAPVMPAVQISDIAGGSLMALSGIMMALFARQQHGKGSYVDVSMSRGLLPWLSYAAGYLQEAERLPRRSNGYITGAFACYNLYETADGKFMSLGALEPVFWQNFCLAVEQPAWVPLQFDEEKRAHLIGEVEALFKNRTRDEWTELFAQHDACCEPVLELPEAVDHPLSRELGFWLEASPTEEDALVMPGFPLLFNGASGHLSSTAPRLGEHTAEIMRSLGYDDSTIAALKNKGSVL